jgi:hypothetical protein
LKLSIFWNKKIFKQVTHTVSCWLFLVWWYISSFKKHITSGTKQKSSFIKSMDHRTSIKQIELSSWWFLNLENRVKQLRLNHAHKIFNNACPSYLKKIILYKLQMENSHCSTPLFHEDLVHWWSFLSMNESIVNDSGASLYGASVWISSFKKTYCTIKLSIHNQFKLKLLRWYQL